MKKVVGLVAVLVVLGWAAKAQAPSIEWQKTYGGSGYDEAHSIIQTSDGFLIAGQTNSTNGNVTGNHGSYDGCLLKLDNAGAIQWQKTIGDSMGDFMRCIIQTSDGGYITAGYSSKSGTHGSNDYWVVKLSSAGAIQWQKLYGGSSFDYAYTIIQCNDGGYAVAGAATSSNGDVTGHHASYDSWVIKLDSTGNIQWQKSLGGNGQDEAYSIIQTADSGFVVGGFSESTDGDVSHNIGSHDFWIVKLTNNGVIQWEKSLGGTYPDYGFSLIQTIDGGYALAGITMSNDSDVTGNHGYEDYWVVKTDSLGNIEWQKALGGSVSDYGYSLVQTIDGGYVVAGYADSDDGDVVGHVGFNGNLIWIAKLNNSGVLQWQKCIYLTKAFSIIQTNDLGYALVGLAGGAGGTDFAIVKLGASTDIEETRSNDLFNLYPNPTTTQLNIEIDESLTGAQLNIYDVTGSLIQTGKLEIRNSQFEIRNLPSGVYIAEIKTKDTSVKNRWVKM